MFPRKFALYGGLVMFLIGAISLIPALAGTADGLPALQNENSYGLFLGLFPMNICNKMALMLVGLGGIASATSTYTSLPASIWFSRAVLYLFGAAAILGILPETNTLYGYWPLFGGEVWLHGIFAAVGGYFGYALSSQVPDQTARGNSDFRTATHHL